MGKPTWQLARVINSSMGQFLCLLILFIFLLLVTDTSLQEEVVRGGVDVGAVESHPGAVRGAEAFSPVLSPTSPTSDTEHTTGTNTTNKRELFIAVFSTVLGC